MRYHPTTWIVRLYAQLARHCSPIHKQPVNHYGHMSVRGFTPNLPRLYPNGVHWYRSHPLVTHTLDPISSRLTWITWFWHSSQRWADSSGWANSAIIFWASSLYANNLRGEDNSLWSRFLLSLVQVQPFSILKSVRRHLVWARKSFPLSSSACIITDGNNLSNQVNVS